jgi:hypothetical protein
MLFAGMLAWVVKFDKKRCQVEVTLLFCHRALVSTGHIFSPNEREAASLVGPGPPLEMIERLSELGAEVSFYETSPFSFLF